MLTSSRGACVDSWVRCENDSMRNTEASPRSIGSSGSILSIGSSGSILSIGSAGCLASVLSVGSVGCVGSVLSGLSQWSLLAWRGNGRPR